MRPLRTLVLLALVAPGCRPYDNYGPIAKQSGLIPAERFARYGREQASLVAIGRSIAAWRMTNDPADLAKQVEQARCFALRLPEVERADPDPVGHRIGITFRSGWRVGVVPVEDGVDPAQTPGIGTLLPAPSGCR
jgi:hypothetical protein